MNESNLATELLHEIKRASKRNFILFIITLEYIAEQLHISADYARKLSQRINHKIIKVI